MQQEIINILSNLFSYIGVIEPQVAIVVGTFVFLFGELMFLFILISFFVGLLQSYISREKIQKALTTRYRFLNSILGAVLGSVTPFCSCSTIPLLVGLRKSRAPFAGMVSFLLTSPILNPMIIIIFFGFFGFVPTLMYAGIALVFAIVVGYTLDRLGFERYFKDSKVETFDEKSDSCCGDKSEVMTTCCAADANEESSCCAALDITFKAQTGSILERHAKVWRFTLKDSWMQFVKIFWYLFIGAGIGSFIYGFVPSEFLVEVAGEQNPFAVPIAAILGVPMYIRTEAVLPLANMLIGQGVGLGTMVALIIGGAGASIPEVTLLSTLFKRQFIVTFILCIFIVAVIAGYAFNILL